MENMFRALGDSARQNVVATLRKTRTLNLDEFVNTEEAWLELHHIHLPYLEEAGVVRYDEHSHRVRRGPNYEDALKLVTTADGMGSMSPKESKFA